MQTYVCMYTHTYTHMYFSKQRGYPQRYLPLLPLKHFLPPTRSCCDCTDCVRLLGFYLIPSHVKLITVFLSLVMII